MPSSTPSALGDIVPFMPFKDQVDYFNEEVQREFEKYKDDDTTHP